MLTKRTAKNQLTLPKEIIKHFEDIEYFDATLENERIILTPVRITPASAGLEAIRKKMEKLGVGPDDVAQAIQWARGKSM